MALLVNKSSFSPSISPPCPSTGDDEADDAAFDDGGGDAAFLLQGFASALTEEVIHQVARGTVTPHFELGLADHESRSVGAWEFVEIDNDVPTGGDAID